MTCPLIEAALADAAAAVNHLTDLRPNYGLSKWSSLQVAEKLLKAAIDRSGGEYSREHKLMKLQREANAAGLEGDWSDLFDDIQCSPGIRYGDESCSRDEALAAHFASLALVFELYVAGAEFEPLT